MVSRPVACREHELFFEREAGPVKSENLNQMNRLIIFTALLLPSLCFGQTSMPADQPASLNKSPELGKVDLDKAEVERLKSKQDPLPAYMLNRLIEEESEAARKVGASTKNLQPE